MAESPDPEVTFRENDVNEDREHEEIGQGDINQDDTVEQQEDVEANEISSIGRPYGVLGLGDGPGIGGHFIGGIKGLPMKPEPYNGKEDWEEYISHFQLCAKLGRWTELDKMLALAASLRGPARTFYISLTAEEKGSYRKLVEQLGKRFGSTRQQNRWLSRLESRRRGQDEGIASLGDDLRQMSQRAYPNLDVQAQERLALNQLYKSISLEMKARCIDRNCSSIAQAVDIIERYEAILGDVQEKKKPVRVVTNSNSQNDQGNQSDGAIQKTLNEIAFALENLQRQQVRPRGFQGMNNQQRRQPLRCFNCNSEDHLVRNCPNTRRQNNEQSGNRQRQQDQGNSNPSSH